MISARDARAAARGVSRAAWSVIEGVSARPVTLVALVGAGMVGMAIGRRLA